MRFAYIALAATFLVAGGASALTMLPEGGTGVTPEVIALLNKATPGLEKILVDDMMFRVDTLAKSGYTGAPWPDGLVFYQFEENLSSYWHS